MSAVSPDETGQALVTAGAKPPLAVPRRLLRMRSDAHLAERFAAGDETAFDVIYERHRPVVLAVCMGVLGTPPDAEDATQETFSALAVALRSRPPAELRPWLIRVARNASIDTTRRRRHRLLTLDGEIPEVAARPHGSGKAELAVVLDGIRELPEGQRMALLMRELGGHSYTEIAEFLATDEEAVKGLIARARVGLRTYREATELSCAAARTTIAAEPDGRRYDKTIRRHLRGCASCRGYRDALRDDARALRAALPIQAGTVATGSLSGGMLSAAKGSLISYGLTQAATTCAASACAVGAIGGMVFVAPVHRLGLPPILPVVKHVPAKPSVAKARHHHRLVVSHASRPETIPPGDTPATATSSARHVGTAAKPAVTRTAMRHHRHVHVTKVVLPRLPKHHRHRHHAPGSAAVDSQGAAAATQVESTSSVTPAPSVQAPATTQAPTTPATTAQVPASASGQDQGNGNANGNPGQGHGRGNAYGSWKTQAPGSTAPTSQATVASPASASPTASVQASQAAATPATPADASPQGTGAAPGNSAHGWGNGHGRWGGTGHGGGPHGWRSSAAAPADAQAPPTSPAATPAGAAAGPGAPGAAPATTVTTAPPTTATTTWAGHGHGWGNGRGSATQAVSSAPTSPGPQPAATNTPSQPAPPGPTITFTNGNSTGQGHGWGHNG